MVLIDGDDRGVEFVTALQLFLRKGRQPVTDILISLTRYLPGMQILAYMLA
jgi:hypothetical protein